VSFQIGAFAATLFIKVPRLILLEYGQRAKYQPEGLISTFCYAFQYRSMPPEDILLMRIQYIGLCQQRGMHPWP
jgi:hypothetical protein